MQFEIGMSTSLYFPPNETAGFALSFVRGYNHVPFPPPKIRHTTFGLIRSMLIAIENIIILNL